VVIFAYVQKTEHPGTGPSVLEGAEPSSYWI